MNIAKLMIPKVSTAFLHENDTVRQGMERFTIHGYTAIPVLNGQEQYIGSVTEGDFLRHLLLTGSTDLKEQEQYRISSLVRPRLLPRPAHRRRLGRGRVSHTQPELRTHHRRPGHSLRHPHP